MNELSTEAKTLLALARDGDRPSARDRERVRRAVLATVGGGAALGGLTAAAGAKAATAATLGASAASAGAAGATATGAGGLGVVACFVLGTALGIGATVPAALVEGDRPDALRPAALSAIAPVVSAAAAQPRQRTSMRPAEPAPAPAPASSAAATVPPTRAPVKRAEASDLAGESALLTSAQESLRRGDPRAALAALERHRTLHPAGALSPEREAARVLALCAAGRRAEARKAAAVFLARNPASPLAARVRAACAE